MSPNGVGTPSAHDAPRRAGGPGRTPRGQPGAWCIGESLRTARGHGLSGGEKDRVTQGGGLEHEALPKSVLRQWRPAGGERGRWSRPETVSGGRLRGPVCGHSVPRACIEGLRHRGPGRHRRRFTESATQRVHPMPLEPTSPEENSGRRHRDAARGRQRRVPADARWRGRRGPVQARPTGVLWDGTLRDRTIPTIPTIRCSAPDLGGAVVWTDARGADGHAGAPCPSPPAHARPSFGGAAALRRQPAPGSRCPLPMAVVRSSVASVLRPPGRETSVNDQPRRDAPAPMVVSRRAK